MKQVRYAIIGSGGIARHFHLRELTNLPNTKLVACCDVDKARAQAMAQEFGATGGYADYREMLQRDDIDAVIVSTWHATHAAIAADALESGRHVLVQKPMTTNMEDANRLVAAAVEGRKKGLKTYCFPFKWTGPFERACEIIRKGDLGRICQARRRVAHGGPPRSSWFYDPDVAIYGALFDMGVYAVSGITALLGPAIACSGSVKSLEESVRIDDNVILLLEFESGAMGIAETSWTQVATKEGTVVYGTEGTLVLGGELGDLLVYQRKHSSDGWFAPECPPTPQYAAHRHFIECVLEDKPPKGTPEHGRHVVEIMLAGYESEKTGRRVPIRTRFEPVVW